MNTATLNLFNKAQELGAVTFRKHQIETYGLYGKVKENFSYHFFDNNDEEVCYYIVSLQDLGLKTFEEPRVWSDEFKRHPSYTQPQRVDEYLFAWQNL